MSSRWSVVHATLAMTWFFKFSKPLYPCARLQRVLNMGLRLKRKGDTIAAPQ